MEFILLGVLLIVFGSFVQASLAMLLGALWRPVKIGCGVMVWAVLWPILLPLYALKWLFRRRPPSTTPGATPSCVVYRFPDRT